MTFEQGQTLMYTLLLETRKMNVFVVLALILHAFGTKTEDLDASKLSQRLKKIKESIGVDYMQDEFNKLPYIQKTGNGTKLLGDIQSKLSASLQALKTALVAVRTEIRDEETHFTTQPSLPLCCMKTGTYMYDPKFRTQVDFSSACLTRSPVATENAKYPNAAVSNTMKTQYQNNKNILWQHYGTTEGISVIYPSTYWTDCENYDPRFRSAFAATASPKDKDVVILLDSSSSMKQISGDHSKTKMLIAKEAARTVIQTLNPNDRIAVISFSSEVSFPTQPSYSSCYSDTLSFASKSNIDELTRYVSSVTASVIGNTNFEEPLLKAFAYFRSSIDIDVSTRDQVVLFLTDGGSNEGRDPGEVIRDENMKLQNRVVIFTYLLGPGASDDMKKQLEEMARQLKSNSSAGNIREGIFKYVDQDQHRTLSMEMATFYEHLKAGQLQDSPVYSIPYVDPFSEIGLITSKCITVYAIDGLHGITCTDVKLSELLKDIDYFENGHLSYGFMIDNTGRALIHPLLPDGTFIESRENPVLVDISSLERSPGSSEITTSMQRGESGTKTLNAVYFTQPRGRLVNEGSNHRLLRATYYWGPVPDTKFFICLVLSEKTHTEISESSTIVSSEELSKVFLYHNRSLTADSYSNCRFNSRKVTLAQSSIKLTPAAFTDPFQYIDKDETELDVREYTDYFTGQRQQNPGFKEHVRATIWATYKAETFWKDNAASHLAWRYIGTKAGFIRVYPAVSLTKSYDHEKRTWWRQTTSHPGNSYITPPYKDAWGSGILLSLEHTIYKRNSEQVTAVIGTDFPLQYFSWFFEQIYSSCTTNEFKCMIIDDSGFLVMHQTFKEISDESFFDDFIHITVQEPAIAKALKEKGVLNKHECQDYSANKELRSYRITLPADKSTGFSFDSTNNQFELRPVSDTNIFILRIRTGSILDSSSADCICAENVKPDFRDCSCDCLCYTPIIYNGCKNMYSQNTLNSSLPCSARLLDDSGISVNEDLSGLQACVDPKCFQKTTQNECYSQSQCSWCAFTDQGEVIDKPCCRLKGECSFGKTRSDNRYICDALSNSDKTEEISGANTGAIVGGVVAAIGIAALIVIGVAIYLRYFKSKGKYTDTDTYLDAIPDEMDRNNVGLHNYGFEQRQAHADGIHSGSGSSEGGSIDVNHSNGSNNLHYDLPRT